MDHDCRGVWIGNLAVAGEPAPAAVGVLHGHEFLDSLLNHFLHLHFIEHGVRLPLFPLRRAFCGVAKFLRIEVGALGLDLSKVDFEILEHLLRDHGGHETIERLLGGHVADLYVTRQHVDARRGVI